jgi:CheY-like chemotaxis protein
MLQYLGQREGIESFSNGQAALEKLKSIGNLPQELPDIILLDINMPVLDGWDFLAQFDPYKKVLSKQPKIYMISSSVDDRDMERAEKNENISKYISKPLDETILKEMMEQETYTS